MPNGRWHADGQRKRILPGLVRDYAPLDEARSFTCHRCCRGGLEHAVGSIEADLAIASCPEVESVPAS